jgi:hypothetical protein
MGWRFRDRRHFDRVRPIGQTKRESNDERRTRAHGHEGRGKIDPDLASEELGSRYGSGPFRGLVEEHRHELPARERAEPLAPRASNTEQSDAATPPHALPQRVEQPYVEMLRDDTERRHSGHGTSGEVPIAGMGSSDYRAAAIRSQSGNRLERQRNPPKLSLGPQHQAQQLH